MGSSRKYLKTFFFRFEGDGNPDDYYVYMKDLNKPWILIQVSSKSVKNVEVVGV